MSHSVERCRVAVAGRLADLTPAEEATLFDRAPAQQSELARVVATIVEDVRTHGDNALRDLVWHFDGVRLDALEVPRATWDAALTALEPRVRAALEYAAQSVRAVHRAQRPMAIELQVQPGVHVGRRPDPLRRVGVYVPGGLAAYPSSVLMGAIPARVAGVGEVVVCSPPGKNGSPSAAVLAACALAGVDRVFALGGAGAVAALAFGTATVPPVDKIVGPGNAYVTEAKRQVSHHVAVDCPAGPSEILVVADDSADPACIATELFAQAEHAPDAVAVLLTTAPRQVEATLAELERLLGTQRRGAIAAQALATRGGILIADSLDQAIHFIERWAPEHVLLLVEHPRQLLPRIRHAGAVFLGPLTSVAFGDYATGANHVLPTGGLARAYSGLSTLDFVRWTTYQEVTSAAAAALAEQTVVLAQAEGLPGHALAARMRAGVRAEGPPSPPPSRPPFGRADYRDLAPYEPGRAGAAVDLSDNTNLFGTPPAARAALARLRRAGVTRYPSVYATELKQAVAEVFGVAPEQVTTGAGSDQVLDAAVRAFGETGDLLAYPDPTFGLIRDIARLNGLTPVPVPLGADFALQVAPLLATQARVTYLCRPNNPTGTAFHREACRRIMEEAAGVVLIDEAYADFADDTLLEFALGAERVVVLRTMSKAYGLAGLRVGFAIGPATLIAEIEKSRGPYRVSSTAIAAAVAALRDGRAWVHRTVLRTRTTRRRLVRALRFRGLQTWPSAANFVLVGVPEGLSAVTLAGELRARDVKVRAFPALPGAGEAIRVTVGPWSLAQTFLRALDEVMACGVGR
jgi:histidinol dehydrogenase